MKYKRGVIGLAVLLTLITGETLMAIEEAKYTVVQKDGQFEIRDYESYLLAEINIEGSMEGASSMAFRPLFNYISGANRSQTKVSMTSPVSQEVGNEEIKMTTPVSQERNQNSWAISFMMPQHFTLETIPTPEDNRVQIREVSGRRVATIRYSGFWSEKGYSKHKAKLESWIAAQGLEPAGPAIWARFNAPFTPWFLRRNEVQIPVIAPEVNP
ncbi:MAG: heme-binding protein [Candidatus Marinimicrobia bacterium]|nr:heme-binding protein [FCB group bacterium]MBL7023951.1 heme-binding protein [Candidatus Neomarinimicrobiota bacterium]